MFHQVENINKEIKIIKVEVLDFKSIITNEKLNKGTQQKI